ncbi:aminopeptidase [Cytophagales bacterium WSM2-2]|nr:aminopeptidase [Cytophagales bacterium WSM2-2]
MKKPILSLFLLATVAVYGQEDKKWKGKFEQLQSELPTPTDYRSASGAPGVKYWQQKADYNITAELNDENQSLTGAETIVYTNNSPDVLKYLWLQLDQNILAKKNMTTASQSTLMSDTLNTMQLYRRSRDFDGGHKIKTVKDATGGNLNYTVNYTMMRIDLPQPLKTGEKFTFSVEWSYNIGDRQIDGQRSGWEYFPEDKNYIYTIAQWFPRMCVYDDVEGWQNKQFLGQGEFALPFGDYKVKLTVPSDHIVAATGTLMNPTVALTKTQLERFEKAKTTFDKPVIIATQAEAIEREKTHATTKKVWEYQATNVRDFAFATSRKFIWDAQAVKLATKTPLGMSYYPKEGNPLWEQESTKAVRNCLETYSKYTIDYPYPVAISVNTANIGMEYPMICFNGGRSKKDGTTDPNTKNTAIAVIIHEVGHNFFPMIINNDERQWTWMDEGINSFLQYRTETERYENFPSWWGTGKSIAPFMKGDKSIQRPVMTNSENIVSFGNEQYAKVATSLSILRESIMGPELFDRSFKEYATRWAFKHPQPADFFRTMEDASAVDLDWFWRGWYYTTDHVDFELADVKWYRMKKDQANVEKKNPTVKSGDLPTADAQPAKDFSQGPKEFAVIDFKEEWYGEFNTRVDGPAVKAKLQDKNFYELTFKNKGGLVMPIVIEWTYKDGTKEIEKLPAELWRLNENQFRKSFIKDKEVASVVIDPNQDMAEGEPEDNVFPRKQKESKFEEVKKKN